ncbi:transcriptional attenuator, LytR family [Granulicatella balaenopterae]|uniref:Transcriptional attenuator, LytR family n=1 Tax=Granulicatella balaenopterae TaxID=137733 RepID=A0A1H9K8Q7_9LACT|nr:LCP family protein [Granulicatella balaenopterae]SEQ95452.1 transcriptional attenuator, LytR family [Granulicatella balaenopterae]
MRRVKEKKENKSLNYINIALTCILVALFSWLLLLLISYRFVSLKIASLIVIILIGVIAALYGFKLRKTLIGVQLLLVLLCGFGISKVKVTIDAFSEMNQTAINEETMYVLALKDSDSTTLKDLAGQSISAPVTFDKANIDQLSEDLANNQITLEETQSYGESYQALKDKKVPAMILNASYASLIESVDPDYLDHTKIIFEKVLTKEQEQPKVSKKEIKDKIEKRVLNIYLSGIDTYGALDKVSRSDSNVLVTVNKDTGRILLTNTPRDSFVKVPGPGNDQYDKLTHAGIYGVETSMATLENLYDIDIDYYARVNFTTLMNLMKVLGSIEVYNSQSFVSLHGNVDFPEGNVTLTADTVLPFVRERYGLSSGDYDRGRNHEKVITAIIKKMLTPAILLNYDQYLDVISKSVQTNLTLEEMAALVNEQIESGQEYTFDSQDLTGHGSMSTECYSMRGQNLYITNIDDNELNKTKARIYGVMEGK